MKKLFTLFLVLVSFSNTILFAQKTNIVQGNLIVMLNDEADSQTLSRSLEFVNGIKTNLKVKQELSKDLNIFLYEFDAIAINENAMLNAVKKNRLVKIAQFNHTFEERTTPNDSLFTNMWDMNNTGQNGGLVDADIDAPEAWDITTGGLTAQGDTIVVAVIDGGFYLPHSDLNFWKNYHEIPNDSIDNDNNGYIDDVKGWNAGSNNDNITSASHGTHVSGTIGAKGNNTSGVVGVNWNVKIMPVMYGSLIESNVVVAYSYVLKNRKLYNQTNGAKGAFVVATNSSFGIDKGQPADYPLWCAMYDAMGYVGILSAGATANQNWNIDAVSDIPTACTSNFLVSVTNTTNQDMKYTGAGFGKTTIDIGAPGTAIWSTLPNNSYGGGSTWTGTSMATPHIAGAIALMYSISCPHFIANYKSNPAEIAQMVKDSLLATVDKIADLDGYTVSGGRLNLYKAIKSMENYCIETGIENYEDEKKSFEIINAYPNPTSQNLTLVINTFENAEIILTNILGQQIMQLPNHQTRQGKQIIKIDISNLSKGIYFVSMKTITKKSNVLKVVVY